MLEEAQAARSSAPEYAIIFFAEKIKTGFPSVKFTQQKYLKNLTFFEGLHWHVLKKSTVLGPGG